MTATARSAPRPQPEEYTAPGLTLGRALRIFLGCPTAWLIAPVLAIAVVARLLVGDLRTADLVVAAVILGFEPLTEWLIHVFVLHFKPRQVWGRRVDPLLSRKHRAHHADPRRLDLVLIPLPALVRVLPIGAAIALLALPLPQALTALVTSYGMLLLYEWTHFLIHSSYRPRGRYYRYVWRAHRLHHFKNENYWFGVTVHLADHVLRTFPAKDAVETSPTARTLGVEEAAA